MKNIFKNAKFGNKFLTRDGKIAIYHEKRGVHHVLFTENDILDYNNDGTETTSLEKSNNDIVSRYLESVDETTLYEKAFEWTSFVKENDLLLRTVALECAIIGYRKAFEEFNKR